MEDVECKHLLPLGQCALCKAPPPGVRRQGWRTNGGRAYHNDPQCEWLHKGQERSHKQGRNVHEVTRILWVEVDPNELQPCEFCCDTGRPRRPGGTAEPARSNRPEDGTRPARPAHTPPSGARRDPAVAEAVEKDVVHIYTDGACIPNPGPGGWGAVLRSGRHEKEIFGGRAQPTTNNRMELTAAIMALEALKRPMTVHLYTDSTYVRNGITKWLASWKPRGWLTATGEPVKNADLWERLEAACSQHHVEWHWVKGHAGHPDNERADQLAAQGLHAACAKAGLSVTAPRYRGRLG